MEAPGQGRRCRGRQARRQAQDVLRARLGRDQEPDGHDRADWWERTRVSPPGHQSESRTGPAEGTGGLRPRQQRVYRSARRVRSRCRRHRRGPTRPVAPQSQTPSPPGTGPQFQPKAKRAGSPPTSKAGIPPGGSRKPRRHRRRLTSPQSRRHPPGASPVGLASSSPFSCSSGWRLTSSPPRSLSAWSESASGLGSSGATRRNHQVSCRPAAPPRGINDTAWPGWHVSGPVRPHPGGPPCFARYWRICSRLYTDNPAWKLLSRPVDQDLSAAAGGRPRRSFDEFAVAEGRVADQGDTGAAR